MRGRLELADAGLVDVSSIEEDAILLLQEGVEFDGRDEGSSIGDRRRLRGEGDEVGDQADGEGGEAAREGEVRGHRGERGSRGQFEVDRREGEARMCLKGSLVGTERGKGASDGDVHAIGRHSNATAQGERAAETLKKCGHSLRVRESHEFVV